MEVTDIKTYGPHNFYFPIKFFFNTPKKNYEKTYSPYVLTSVTPFSFVENVWNHANNRNT